MGFHGLRGLLKLELLSDAIDVLDVGHTVYLEGKSIKVTDAVIHGGRLLIKLEGFTDRNSVEPLRGKLIEAEEQPIDPEQGSYRISDLVGCQVVTVEGRGIGAVDAIEPMPAQDLLVIGEIMLPFAHQFVKKVDLDARVITVELIPGMLPEDAE